MRKTPKRLPLAVRQKETIMNLFTPDLFRNFAFGFVGGGLIIGLSAFGVLEKTLDAPVNAATPFEAPQPSSEFLIAPLDS
ncbi:MAG: hypothetical protein ABJ205_08635 [Erythrobacter sp.]|uniref:hypothetical protein n=1 Tax=Erythrobacter sp. TaxID=1042 RepID=UPI00326435F9